MDTLRSNPNDRRFIGKHFRRVLRIFRSELRNERMSSEFFVKAVVSAFVEEVDVGIGQ